MKVQHLQRSTTRTLNELLELWLPLLGNQRLLAHDALNKRIDVRSARDGKESGKCGWVLEHALWVQIQQVNLLGLLFTLVLQPQNDTCTRQ